MPQPNQTRRFLNARRRVDGRLLAALFTFAVFFVGTGSVRAQDDLARLIDQAKREFTERATTAGEIKQAALERHQSWSLIPAGIDGPGWHLAPTDKPVQRIDEQLTAAETLLTRFQRMWAPRFMVGDRWLWGCFIVWIAISASGLLMPQWWYGPIAATALVVILGIGLRFLLAGRSR